MTRMQAEMQAFEKNKEKPHTHDYVAAQTPADKWVVVAYSRNRK